MPDNENFVMTKMTDELTTTGHRFWINLIAIAFVVTMAMMAWLVWSTYNSYAAAAGIAVLSILLFTWVAVIRRHYKSHASLLTKRKQTEHVLQKAHNELEVRVQERTTELTRVNASLKEQVLERARSEAALRESEEKFRSVTQSAVYAIVAADAKGEIISWNNGAQNIFGYEEADVLGKSLTILMPEVYRTAHLGGMERYARTGEAHVIGRTVEVHGLRRGGEEFPLELSLTSWKSGKETFYSGIIRDITVRKRVEKHLTAQHAVTQALADSATLKEAAAKILQATCESLGWDLGGLWIADRETNVLRCLDIWHLPSAEFTEFEALSRQTTFALGVGLPGGVWESGKPAWIPDVVSDPAFPRALVAAKDGLHAAFAFPVLREGEILGVIEFFSSGIRQPDDELLRVMSTIGTQIGQFIERRRFESELAEARDTALESVRLKSEFLANMSHEIRTPMNGVVGMTGLLLDTELSSRQQEYTETIQSSADALLRIIDDILDFSKIEAGLLRFEKIDFELRGAVEAPLEVLAEKGQTKGLEVASLVYQDVPTALRGDPGRLRQVLTNLIGNAVKFTERGEVIVSVSKTSETAEDALLRFEITDTGIGISKVSQRRLIHAFMQADGSTTRKYGGTGLGLAISRQLVELMGGEIGIESKLGEGSTFWFTARFEKQLGLAATSEKISANLAGVRVLIVDDNTTNRRILDHQTTSWGMIATHSESGERALELLHAAFVQGKPFDIAILDLMMPGMNGFKLAEAIKADAEIAPVALVLLPSYGKRGHGEAARQVGIAAYLQKPVRQSELHSCLTAVMAQVTSGDIKAPDLVTRYSLRETEARQKLRPNLSGIRILVAEDNAVNQKVALGQLRSLGYRAEAVPNGKVVLKLMAKEHFDLILMDCQMPLMNGFETTEEIRRRESTQQINGPASLGISNARRTTIIAMTAAALEGDREKCLAAGMDDYLSKPIKSDELRLKLEQWTKPTNISLGNKQNGSKVETPAYTGELSVVDLSVLAGHREIQQPGQADFVTELIDLFLKDTVLHLKILHGAVSKNDDGELRRVAHLLKGGSANIGAARMTALYEQLETKKLVSGVAATLVSKIENEFEGVREALKAERR